MLELLAPAGSMESITAAVQNGADAVYFGYGDFNARRNAKNFSAEEAAAAVSYCHLRGCKVHLTLNTLLTDRELEGARKLLNYCRDNHYTLNGDYICEEMTELNLFDNKKRNMFMRLQVPVTFSKNN